MKVNDVNENKLIMCLHKSFYNTGYDHIVYVKDHVSYTEIRYL